MLADGVEARVVAAYMGGSPTSVITGEFGIGAGTIYAILRRHGYGPDRVSRRFDDELVAAYLGGVPTSEIAERFGVAPSSIYRHLRAAGLSPNRHSRA